jgi:hypothetical protein
MWILIRIVHDADDGNTISADLTGNIAVEIFRRHHRNPVFGVCRSALGESRNKNEREAQGKGFGNGFGNGFHAEKPMFPARSDLSYIM